MWLTACLYFLNQCNCFFFPFLKTKENSKGISFYSENGQQIGEGLIYNRNAVHVYPLKEDEIAMLITMVDYIHPCYSYPLEEGGFSAWKRNLVDDS